MYVTRAEWFGHRDTVNGNTSQQFDAFYTMHPRVHQSGAVKQQQQLVGLSRDATSTSSNPLPVSCSTEQTFIARLCLFRAFFYGPNEIHSTQPANQQSPITIPSPPNCGLKKYRPLPHTTHDEHRDDVMPLVSAGDM